MSEQHKRMVPEGYVPLLSVEGSTLDCGREYASLVMERYPGYRRYLDKASAWLEAFGGAAEKLLDRHAPHIVDVYRGLVEIAGPASGYAGEPGDCDDAGTAGGNTGPGAGCTSFGVAPEITLDGTPISGQTKDTELSSASRYIVLHMRISGAPEILVLAYPGEVLGYGFWSTGMSLFRNSLYSRSGSSDGLTMEQWGLVALSSEDVRAPAELAREYGIRGAGNVLISDGRGESLSVEHNGAGVSIVPAKEGIATHGNHPEGELTATHEEYQDDVERANSRYRMHGLWTLLDAERGRLSPQKAMHALADHSRYPRGICRHTIGGSAEQATTAAVVVEPKLGRLHVTRGNPCCNWPVTYTI